MEHGPVEIVSFPSYKMVDLSIVMWKFTRGYFKKQTMLNVVDMFAKKGFNLINVLDNYVWHQLWIQCQPGESEQGETYWIIMVVY